MQVWWYSIQMIRLNWKVKITIVLSTQSDYERVKVSTREFYAIY